MLLESQHLPSNQDHNWLGSIGILQASMLESQQLRSNLDQDWMRGLGIVPEGVLESQQSRSNLDQDWLRGMGIRGYARITEVSVKSGSRLAAWEVVAYYQ